MGLTGILTLIEGFMIYPK